MAVKNLRETKVYLTPDQGEFLDQIILTAQSINPRIKLSRSDIIRTFIDRFNNEQETEKSKMIMKAISFLSAKKLPLLVNNK